MKHLNVAERCIAFGALVALSMPCIAQDFAVVGDMGVAMGQSTLSTAMINSTIENATSSSRIASRRYARRGAAAHEERYANSAPSFEQGRSLQPAALPYQVTAAASRQALDEYVSRIARRNPEAARLTAEQFNRHDATRIYRGIIKPFGLHDGDVAEALTAYTVLSWLIATGAPDPGPDMVGMARLQIAERMANDRRITSAASRAELGEELKLLFVTLHAGWQSARREGNLRQYSDGVAALFQRQGTDLRALRLTERGFVGR